MLIWVKYTIGNILRILHNRIIRVFLKWTPRRKIKQGRPKAAGRRTVVKDIKAMGLAWGEAEMSVLEKICWRQRVRVSLSALS